MSAIRLARGFTGREKIIKFEGCYHGHSDSLLVKSGSGTLTFRKPTSSGVPYDTIKHTIVCEYNNIESVKEAVRQFPDDIACVILEPIAGNMGVVPSELAFIQELRALTEKEGIVLIFDEVITGFRTVYGIHLLLFRVQVICTASEDHRRGPAVGHSGQAGIMEHLSPVGGVYQAGTLSAIACHENGAGYAAYSAR